MSEVKRIPTFSWVLRRAEALLRKDPAEYGKLRGGTSDKFLKGCISRLDLGESNASVFLTLYTPQGRKYATLHGVRHKGELYTVYHPQWFATTYRKRMHRFLPVSLPQGVKPTGQTECIYFNADGTVAMKGFWHGGRRGRAGSPCEEYMVIRDRDGKFVKRDEMKPLQDRSLYNMVEFHRASNPVDLWHDFLPGTCHSKLDWYSSMAVPKVPHFQTKWASGQAEVTELPGPLWDEQKMKTLAARVHSEALRVSKQYPHIKIALYPMAVCTDGDPKELGHHDPVTLTRFSQRHGDASRDGYVLGRDKDDEPIRYYLPELVAYWTLPGDKVGGHFQVEAARWIRVVIPPVGCESLLMGPDKTSAFCKFYRWGRTKYPSNYTNTVVGGRSALERAYHQLVAGADNTWQRKSIRHFLNGGRSYHRHGEHTADKVIHDWSEKKSVAVVWDNSPDRVEVWSAQDPYVSRPEDIFKSIEEKELMDSLPLC